MRLIDVDALRARLYFLYAGNVEKWCEERGKHTETLLNKGALKEAVESEKRQTAFKTMGSVLALIKDMETAEASAEPEKGMWDESGEHTADEVERILVSDYVPSTQPKKGKWMGSDDNTVAGYCSVCGWEALRYETDVAGMPFCPNCGAKMEGEADDV